MLDDLHQQINKRLTLNLLIQGAASHTCLSAHHLVRDELEELRPGLVKLYDKFAFGFALNYIIGDLVFFYGRPSRFWKRIDQPTHPFHRHGLFAKHGWEMCCNSRRYLAERGKAKGVRTVPVIQTGQFYGVTARVAWAEWKNHYELARLAEKAASTIWGIDVNRLHGQITTNVAFGNLRMPRTAIGRKTRQCAVGYGGVCYRDGEFEVVAKAWFFPLLVHELVKGTAELVCLHGLNTLDDVTYELATAEADQLEYETWMLQTGGDAWRRFLAAIPPGIPFPHALMHVARMEPPALEQLMLAIFEDPDFATEILATLKQ